jgi:hypothetical protein
MKICPIAPSLAPTTLAETPASRFSAAESLQLHVHGRVIQVNVFQVIYAQLW